MFLKSIKLCIFFRGKYSTTRITRGSRQSWATFVWVQSSATEDPRPQPRDGGQDQCCYRGCRCWPQEHYQIHFAIFFAKRSQLFPFYLSYNILISCLGIIWWCFLQTYLRAHQYWRHHDIWLLSKQSDGKWRKPIIPLETNSDFSYVL